jgi:hypothetical protein
MRQSKSDDPTKNPTLEPTPGTTKLPQSEINQYQKTVESLEQQLSDVDLQLAHLQKLMRRRDDLRMAIGHLKRIIADDAGELSASGPEDFPLWKRLEQILSQSKEPMTVKQLADAVIALGGKIDTSSPPETVRTNLLRKPDIFERTEAGLYKVKNSSA